MSYDLPRVPARIGSAHKIKYSHPDIMSYHDYDYDLYKCRELMRYHSLIAQITEGGADIERKYGNDYLFYYIKDYPLELLQQLDGSLALGPYCRKSNKDT